MLSVRPDGTVNPLGELTWNRVLGGLSPDGTTLAGWGGFDSYHAVAFYDARTGRRLPRTVPLPEEWYLVGWQDDQHLLATSRAGFQIIDVTTGEHAPYKLLPADLFPLHLGELR
ncbi:hypothetical protein [Microtetraspora glauca]|uniref:Uncharacterized protein n=1 Tax=Microtetraspora glauca TaxID=1996 RepID=A0ABV3GSQ9_MICGL